MSYLRLSVLVLLITASLAGCNRGKSYLLKQVAEEVSGNCPLQIDYMTTLVSCEYLPEKILKYNYIIDLNLSELDKETFCKSMKTNVIQQISVLLSEKESQPLKALDPTFIHSYKTVDGNLVCEITVTPEMYAKPLKTDILSDEEMYADLQNVAAYLTPEIPVEIEDGFFLTEVRALPPRTLEFNYKIIYLEYDIVDTITFKESLIPVLAVEIRNNPSEQSLKDNNVVFRYVYHDANYNYLCSINITPEDYK